MFSDVYVNDGEYSFLCTLTVLTVILAIKNCQGSRKEILALLNAPWVPGISRPFQRPMHGTTIRQRGTFSIGLKMALS